MNSEEFGIGCAEALEILRLMKQEDINKLDPLFVSLLNANKKQDHLVILDPDKPLEEQNISETGKAILSIAYRDYFASPEEKASLLEKDRLAIEELKMQGKLPK